MFLVSLLLSGCLFRYGGVVAIHNLDDCEYTGVISGSEVKIPSKGTFKRTVWGSVFSTNREINIEGVSASDAHGCSSTPEIEQPMELYFHCRYSEHRVLFDDVGNGGVHDRRFFIENGRVYYLYKWYALTEKKFFLLRDKISNVRDLPFPVNGCSFDFHGTTYVAGYVVPDCLEYSFVLRNLEALKKLKIKFRLGAPKKLENNEYVFPLELNHSLSHAKKPLASPHNAP
jgi:hypothetical protein